MSGPATIPKVLVVDDEQAVRAMLAATLGAAGFEVIAAADGNAALTQATAEAPSVMILDLRMPGLDGIETLRRLKTIAPEVPVIILTGHGDVVSAVEAMRLGAYDYLTKPVAVDAIVLAVVRALERQQLGAEIAQLKSKLHEDNPLRWLMCPSPEIQQVVQQVRQVADSSLRILIEGETGTGKELVARAIHATSTRRERPFVALDCGAIPETLIESELFGYERGAFTGADRRKEGHFQLAAGGSLFLDEIGNLPLTTQAKLLRVLQEGEVHVLGGTRPVPVDARILAASNLPLEREMQAGRFRQDLYYRLGEFVIVVPPLRERREDIPYLANRFLAEASMELRRPVHGFSDEALRALVQYSWPGNVRELRNVIRRAVIVSSDIIGPEHLVVPPSEGALPLEVEQEGPVPVALPLKDIAAMAATAAERAAIRRALQAARGNKSAAARLLMTDFKTLHLKMKRYGIDAREFRP